MAISRSEVRKLTKHGVEAGARVLRGLLTTGPGGTAVGQVDLDELLTQLDGQEVIVVIATVGNIAIESEIKTCYTCGRDYKGDTCPHCAEAWARLRG